MTTFVITTVIAFIILLLAGSSKSNSRPAQKSVDSPEPLPQHASQKTEPMTDPVPSSPPHDDSIIDVTGQTHDIKTKMVSYPSGVPYWKHQYIYSYHEITSASAEQLNFYEIFKYQFLKGQYFDLEGNNNYAFILLFDLLTKEFNNHDNFLLLERQLEELGYYYPKTRPYCRSFLIQKLERAGDGAAADRIRSQSNNSSVYDPTGEYTFEGYYWGFGTKYKTKLNLNDDEVKLLNLPLNNGTRFSDIEFCRIQILKLYLAVIKVLEGNFKTEHTSLEDVFTGLTDMIATKFYRFKQGSMNYRYSLDMIKRQLYTLVLEQCENAIREKYRHKRKLSTHAFLSNPASRPDLELKVLIPVVSTISQKIHEVPAPDISTEIELNAQTTTRWKAEFEEICKPHVNQPVDFFDKTKALAELNKNNPSVENIFFEASKHIAKTSKEVSLKLYLYYLYCDLRSANFDNKPLTKTIQKSLFKTNDQLHQFEIIVGDLVKDKDLDKALTRLADLYKPKRKTISLDRKFIEDVKDQHTETVELLNEYLSDEYEDDTTSIKSQQINNDEVRLEIASRTDHSSAHSGPYCIPLSLLQADTLEFFVKNNFSVPGQELEEFARSKGAFTNQLIQSINESCYEKLDDILIEEDEDYFTINSNYYQTLLAP